MPANQTRLKIKTITLILFLGLCAFSILRALSIFSLSPDSTGYITAAQNFIRTGHLFVYANSPSWTLEPAIEPYTEQPPGMPLFLAPFLLVLKQPIVGAAAAQASAIILFYLAVFALTKNLQVSPFFQMVCVLAFTLFRPLQIVFSNFWSETLFIALTFWSIHFLVAARRSNRPDACWVIALILAAAATLVRAIGVLTLGIFLLATLQRNKNRLAWAILSLVFLCGPLIGWSMRNQLLYGATSMTHFVEKNIDWVKLLLQAVFLREFASHNTFIAVLIALFVLICLLAPFLRPDFPGRQAWRFKTDFTHVPGYSPLLSVLGIAIVATALFADRLGFGGNPGLGLKQYSAIGLGLFVVAVAWVRNTNLIEYLRNWKAYNNWDWWKSRQFFTFAMLLSGGLFQFIGITALSLVTLFSPLQDRLLAPSLALLLFAVLYGLYHFSGLIRTIPWFAGILSMAIVLAIISPAFIKADIAFQPGFHFPPEQQLWQELDSYPGISRVTHFYSDHNFNHQIYANRPQRIILIEDQINEGGFLTSLMSKGNCPFVLVNKGDHMSQLMQQSYQKASLSERDLVDGQFELYAQDCLFSP